MNEHPIQGLMKTAMESIKDMVDVNTVVGNPVETVDGQMIIPVSRVAFGFAAGGGEYGVDRAPNSPAAEFPFGGGSGAGVSVQPMGFLVVGQNHIRMLPVDGGQTIERVIDMAPQLIEKVRNAMGTMQNGQQTGMQQQTNGNLIIDPNDVQ